MGSKEAMRANDTACSWVGFPLTPLLLSWTLDIPLADTQAAESESRVQPSSGALGKWTGSSEPQFSHL